ncbi:MAG: GNAT family N-acetyltransferase [Candidatus Brocadiaceae bacterium]|nr:GNAT family N-acetyltransferase [Candidatus Brocadiaceae bacterium]
MAERELRPFDPDRPGPEIAVVNAFTAGWPYSRPIDEALVRHWRTQPGFEPDLMLTAWRGGRPRAFIHGERVDAETGGILILAVPPGNAGDGAWLLEEWGRLLSERNLKHARGPGWRSGACYGGFVIGQEPYLPSWADGAIESFIRAGYRMKPSDVILIRDLSEPIRQEAVPEGYEVIEVDTAPEYDADVFGYHAVRDGRKAAHCYARLYPHLRSPDGTLVGQIGNVTTQPEHRSRGLARIMVQMSLRRLADMGAGEALIATGLENFPALRAYERAGYRRRYLITEWMKDL